MTLTSIGDLARGLSLQLRSAQIKSDIETLSLELSTGKSADPASRLGGDYSHIAQIDRDLTRLDTFAFITSEARLFADGMQDSLTTLGNAVSDLSSSLLAFGSANQAMTREQASVQARNDLDTMMAALNTQVGGRSLFSGTATDKVALDSPDALLTALRAEIAGTTTAADAQLAAETWFNDTAGFQAVIYQGSADALAPMRVSETERVGLGLTANDPALRDALRGAALAALATDASLSLTPEERTTLLKDIGVELANTGDDTVRLRAEVGVAQAKTEQAATRNAAARTGLEYSKTQLIGADPYETATRLQHVQFQLESLYSVTVRNANLSLVNFLR